MSGNDLSQLTSNKQTIEQRSAKRRARLIRVYMFGGFLAVVGFSLMAKNFIGTPTSEAQTPVQEAYQAQQRAQGQGSQGQGQGQQPSPNEPSGRTLRVLAIVNGDQITRQQLADECLLRFGNDVIERLVNRQLILNECQRKGINITPQQMDAETNRIAAKFGIPGDRYLELLQTRKKITPEQHRNEIVWPTLALRALARDKIRVSPEEINQQIETEIGPKVQVRLIALEDAQTAQKVLELAKAKPEEFGKLAKDYSVDPNSASTRGMVPPIRLHIGDENLERVAFGLQPGQISDVLELGNQFLILRCEKHFPSQIEELGPEQRQQFENRITEQLGESKLAAAAQELFKHLQDTTKITNVYNDPKLRAQMPGIAAQIGDVQVSIRELAEECIMRHGSSVLDGEINRMMLTQQLKRANKTVSEDDINQEIYRAADAYGMLQEDGTPDVDKWLEYITSDSKVTVELYVHDVVWPTAALKKLVEGSVNVSDDDLQKGFESNFGERVEALAVVCANQKQAQEVWKLANQNPSEEYFGDLANAYSVEPASKANFGRVPPIQKHGGRKALEDEAFRLNPGELSGIVNIGESWVILRCVGRTTPRVRPEDFEDVREELHKDILEKKLRLAMNDRFDQVRRASQIDNYLAGTSQIGAGGNQQRTAQAVQNRMPFRVR